MAEERSQRRLAAILAANVVGYSRLMEADETGTLAALKERRREVLDPLIAQHQGRIFKTTGDGVLVEFGSAVDAVQCAVELQQAMAQRNAAVPEDRRLTFRMGVNLSDVMSDNGDVFGDGVNIAARLEALATPGSILVSHAVHEQVVRTDVVGDLVAREPHLDRDVVFGSKARDFVEDRLAAHVMACWRAGRSSLRRPLS